MLSLFCSINSCILNSSHSISEESSLRDSIMSPSCSPKKLLATFPPPSSSNTMVSLNSQLPKSIRKLIKSTIHRDCSKSLYIFLDLFTNKLTAYLEFTPLFPFYIFRNFRFIHLLRKYSSKNESKLCEYSIDYKYKCDYLRSEERRVGKECVAGKWSIK